MEYLSRLHESRMNLIADARSMLEAAQAEGRELTADEENRWNALNTEIDAKAAKIEELKAAEARFAAAESYREPLRAVLTPEKPRDEEVSQRDILRAILSGERRSHDFELRALTTGTATVPVTFADFVSVALQTLNPTYAAALAGGGVIQTATGDTLRIPTWSDQTSAMVAEAGTASVSDPTISSVQLGAYKVTTLQRFSAELATDNVINLESLIGQAAGRSIAYTAGSYMTVGAGSTEPKGFITAIGASATATGTPFFTPTDLMTLFYSLAVPYRQNAVWQVSNGALAKLRKATDTSGQFLWQPSLIVGQPDTFLGRPVYENPHMAAVASASKSIALYDPAEFKVRVVGGIQVARSTDLYFASDEIAVRASWRFDSNMPQTAAGKVLVSANS